MSLNRFFRWTCDCCGFTINRQPHGIPDGWKWMTRSGGTIHACHNCTPKLKEEGWKEGTEPHQFVK